MGNGGPKKEQKVFTNALVTRITAEVLPSKNPSWPDKVKRKVWIDDGKAVSELSLLGKDKGSDKIEIGVGAVYTFICTVEDGRARVFYDIDQCVWQEGNPDLVVINQEIEECQRQIASGGSSGSRGPAAPSAGPRAPGAGGTDFRAASIESQVATNRIIEAIVQKSLGSGAGGDLLVWFGLKGEKPGPETTVKLYNRILQLIREGKFDHEQEKNTQKK